MELLKNLISENKSDLIAKLTQSGFGAEQAERFLPEAGGQIADLIGKGNKDVKSITDHLDLSALAAKVGIDTNLASQGIQALIPIFLSKLGSGGVLGKVMGMFR